MELNKFRILHIVTELERGGSQFNTILSTEDVIRRGHRAWMVASPGPLSGEARKRLGDNFIELGGTLDLAKIPGSRIRSATSEELHPMVRRISPLADYRAYRSLRRIIAALRPSIVHTHSSKAGILGRWAARHGGVPHVVHTAHGWGFHDHQYILTRKFYEFAERVTADITDRIVVVSDANRRKALEREIGRTSQYITIRSGVDVDAEPLISERSQTRAELGIPDDAFVLIWAGNFKPQKDPITMTRVASRVLKERPDAHVVVVGDGLFRTRVERRFRRGLKGVGTERLHLLGWREDVPRLIAASDLLFHTALFEGLPRVILESLSCGVPVFSTAVDGIPEAVVAGESGHLFEPKAHHEMAEEIIAVAGDREKLAHLAEGARKGLSDEFTLEAMFEELEWLYRDMACER